MQYDKLHWGLITYLTHSASDDPLVDFGDG